MEDSDGGQQNCWQLWTTRIGGGNSNGSCLDGSNDGQQLQGTMTSNHNGYSRIDGSDGRHQSAVATATVAVMATAMVTAIAAGMVALNEDDI